MTRKTSNFRKPSSSYMSVDRKGNVVIMRQPVNVKELRTIKHLFNFPDRREGLGEKMKPLIIKYTKRQI